MMQAVTLAIAILVLSFASQAQYRAPQPERKTPRAVGVLETYKNGSRRLVPITFFYEKHFYDATLYHATPVPFTLYSETVYEVQQFGKPLGNFTVQSATQNSAAWFGNGRFKLLPDPALMAKKNPATVVVEDSSRPVLHRHEGSEGDNPVAHPTPTATSPADEDPDRPKLHRREDSSGDASAPTGSAPAGSASPGASAQVPAASPTPENQPAESSGQDPDRPKLHRKEDSGENSGKATPPPASPKPVSTTSASAAKPAPSTVAAELTPSDDPDHPILRRGQPVQIQGGRDLPDFKKEEPVSRQVAISDAGPSEAQSLIYVCREEERQQIELSARALAQAELRRLAAQRGIASVASAKAPSTSRKIAAAKTPILPELKFEDEQFIPYDLDYNNYATVVFSARYAPQSTSAATAPSAEAQSAIAKSKSWVVTVVARETEGNKLVKLFAAVSDPRELALYPEVRLVDALDPDGYGRAALLFREQKRDGVSWLLGRVTGYEMQPILETPSR
jgi:hypothetical protein